MRIGIDAREIGGRSTGVGRYLGGLLEEWSTSGATTRHEFVLYAHEPIDPHASRLKRMTVRVVGGAGGTWWEQTKLARAAAADRLDVFFAPAYTAPLRLRTPTVLTIHDLSFIAHPEWFRPREGLRRRWLTRRAAERAGAVITVSQFSRNEILRHLRLRGDRVHVIPQGIDPPQGAGRARTEPRVLYVGSIFNRRRLPDLIHAFAALLGRHPTAALDIVGDNRTYPHEDVEGLIGTERLAGHARYHRYVAAAHLGELYAGARAFAFLSEYEGLGMTPLEALAAGVPPVLLDTAVARESCGDAALYVPQGDLAATTNALEALLFAEETRRRVLGAAAGVLARVSWPRAARETLEVIEKSGTVAHG
jgi:glycosyltransferase involved in cell wall biosynthesis